MLDRADTCYKQAAQQAVAAASSTTSSTATSAASTAASTAAAAAATAPAAAAAAGATVAASPTGFIGVQRLLRHGDSDGVCVIMTFWASAGSYNTAKRARQLLEQAGREAFGEDGAHTHFEHFNYL